MTDLFQNRRFAVIIAALVSVIAVFAGSKLSINDIKNSADNYFRQGDGTFSVVRDLEKKSAVCGNIVSLWVKYNKSESNETKALDELRRRLPLSYDSPKIAASISEEMTSISLFICGALQSQGLSDSDLGALERQKVDLLAVDDILKRTDYNDFAQKQNDKLNSFPLVVFKLLSFSGGVEYFK